MFYNCRQVGHKLSESYDRPLHWVERSGVRVHLWMCRGCAELARQLRLIERAAQSYEARLVAGEVADKLQLPLDRRARIRAALQQAGAP